MKRFLCIFLSFSFILIYSFNAFAQSFSSYGSVTNSTSYVNTLLGYYLNSQEYKWNNQFIIMRSGQYQYDLFYGPELSGTVKYYRLTQQSSGYNSEWVFSSGSVSNFSYNLGNYTAVGNVPGTIRSSEYGSQRWYFLGEIFLVIIIIALFIRLFRFGGSRVELH